MFLIILIFLAGIGLGYLSRSIRNLNLFSGRISFLLVFLLLFSLGLSVGMNNIIIDNLVMIGLQSLTIAIFAISGSVILLLIFSKLRKK